MSNFEIKHKVIEHPLEEIFDIEPSTTMVEYKEMIPAEVIEMPNYDKKDDEIEGKLEEIFSVAMTQVAVISDELERVEGKFKARMGEVTATMLNVALGAVNSKAALKMHKDKLGPVAGSGSHTVNNNLIVADRNEILRALAGKNKQPE